ncbi:MAG TPA: 1-deoxy-D-xylulose-5-phosphate synthase N-terminal domain-containing protein [Syntrophales bacterium]|nr:1-deoxy-D-xylulose-5-phosphate synthase N-terminal domain-containing protein [Syntrophales bacterium]
MNEVCKGIRKEILRIAKESGHGHIPTCFSIVESLYAVYESIRHDPRRPLWEDRDIFILSKGHGALAHYCVLAHHGYFPGQGLVSFGSFGSTFGCHADRFKVAGIEASTGSLGHGIGLAVGMALALKIRRSDRRVVTLIGDGEANEGSVWESTLVASHLKLNNLAIIYDDNQSHGRGLQIRNAADKFRAFDCYVTETEGHDVNALKEALSKRAGQVHVIVAHTCKGFGCSTLIKGQYEWHRKSPNDEEYKTLTRELDEAAV